MFCKSKLNSVALVRERIIPTERPPPVGKSIIKKPYMFRSLLYDHPQGLSFVLSAFNTFPLLASSFAFPVCDRMPSICMCVRCSCLWVVCRQHTDSYTGHTYTYTAYGHIPKRQMTKQAAEKW
jgi:hypothetical protein